MKRITDWLTGVLRVAAMGADPERCLNRLSEAGIAFWDIAFPDAFQVEFTIYEKDRRRVFSLAERSACRAEVREAHGFRHRYRGLKKRVPLLAAVALSVALSVILPRFIWFYSVEGNERVPAERILRAVRDTGVGLGIYGPSIDPQSVKNSVLAEIPELSWLTVTQNGACAVIRVRERPVPEPSQERRTPSDLVASRDALVTELSVWEGSAAVKPGDAVLRGQVLISGMTDLERTVRMSAALGEVYARTWREMTLVKPAQSERRTRQVGEKKVLLLQFGKNRIKISPGSGIFPPAYDKMTVTKYLALPNGYTLPIALVIESGTLWDTEQSRGDGIRAKDQLAETARTYAMRDMIAGSIENENLRFSEDSGGDVLHAVLECREMIARRRRTEQIKGGHTNDGTRSQRGAPGTSD